MDFLIPSQNFIFSSFFLVVSFKHSSIFSVTYSFILSVHAYSFLTVTLAQARITTLSSPGFSLIRLKLTESPRFCSKRTQRPRLERRRFCAAVAISTDCVTAARESRYHFIKSSFWNMSALLNCIAFAQVSHDQWVVVRYSLNSANSSAHGLRVAVIIVYGLSYEFIAEILDLVSKTRRCSFFLGLFNIFSRWLVVRLGPSSAHSVPGSQKKSAE